MSGTANLINGHIDEAYECDTCGEKNGIKRDYVGGRYICDKCYRYISEPGRLWGLCQSVEDTTNALVTYIRQWFKFNGDDGPAVIGISGGKDSTVAAALCVEALGTENVVGVIMPNGAQEDLDVAIEVCEYLKIRYRVCNIRSSYERMMKEVEWFLNNEIDDKKISSQTKQNLPPRIRMALLYAISQSINGRVICTDNLSEAFIGYSTRWGDSVGDVAPLAKLTSDEVILIGDNLGLPHKFIYKVPADGLCGKTDEDRFGFTYRELNSYIRFGYCKNKETEKKIEGLHSQNLFKSRPIPFFQPF